MDNYGTHKTKAIRDWFAKRASLGQLPADVTCAGLHEVVDKTDSD